ncbi:MAG: hypothetical protein LIP16_00975 [Clostridium sp.]|nr:hypothetical protein [Clostridium sp.]
MKYSPTFPHTPLSRPGPLALPADERLEEPPPPLDEPPPPLPPEEELLGLVVWSLSRNVLIKSVLVEYLTPMRYQKIENLEFSTSFEGLDN